MKYLITACHCLLMGAIVFFIVKAICEAYYDALRKTGETVMAREVIGMQVAPYILAIIAVLIVIKLRHE